MEWLRRLMRRFIDDRACDPNDGFYEWYGKGGVPSGSGNFKGSAGVLSKAIELLRDWAEKIRVKYKRAILNIKRDEKK